MTVRQFLFLLIMAGGIVFLRAFPGLLFGHSGKVPSWLIYLSHVLTAAAIAMLVVYSTFGVMDYGHCGNERLLPALGCLALTTLLHIIAKNPLISILAGTIVYMILIQ